MTPQSRKALESLVSDMDKWMLEHPLVDMRWIKSRLERVIQMDKDINGHKSTNPPIHEITPCERVSFEKCLDRLDEEIKRLKGQVSHDAWGPKWTPEQSIYMKELKAKKKEILGKLGLPI